MKLMEMSEKMRMVVLLVSSALFFPSASAATWYAKAANYGQSGLDGRSEATAWGTLQDAHDNASAGDTIRVLPGDYDQGTQTASDGVPSRLVVSKKLAFESTIPRAAYFAPVIVRAESTRLCKMEFWSRRVVSSRA